MADRRSGGELMWDDALPLLAPAPDLPSAVATDLAVLVIDECVAERRSLATYLATQGFVVQEAEREQDAETLLGREPFEVVVVALDRSVLTVADFLRRTAGRRQPALIVLAGLPDSMERVLALQLGADDLLARDTSFTELLARIRAVVRRMSRHDPSTGNAASTSGASWVLNEARRTLTSLSGVSTALSRGDCDVLGVFLDHEHGMVTEAAIARIFGHRPACAATNMRTLVSRLKRRIGGSHDAFPITCVRGVGYRLDAPIRRVPYGLGSGLPIVPEVWPKVLRTA